MVTTAARVLLRWVALVYARLSTAASMRYLNLLIVAASFVILFISNTSDLNIEANKS